MTKKELKESRYYITIDAKDLKDGMKIIDEDDCDDPKSEIHVLTVSNIRVSDEKITFRAVGIGKRDYTYELFREPEEPMISVYFSSVEEGLYFGFPLNYIKKYERR